MAAYVIVEGPGDVEAVVTLLMRLVNNCGLSFPHFGAPIRAVGIQNAIELRRQAERVRAKPDAQALLVLRDSEDDCPRDLGPKIAALLAELRLPFPSAVVLAYREYESLFLPCIEQLAGLPFKGQGGQERPGLRPDARFDSDDFESKRNVKKLLTERMPRGKSYKPSVDQLPMTRMVDFSIIRKKNLAWFGTLERALQFLAANVKPEGETSEPIRGQTYPPGT